MMHIHHPHTQSIEHRPEQLYPLPAWGLPPHSHYDPALVQYSEYDTFHPFPQQDWSGRPHIHHQHISQSLDAKTSFVRAFPYSPTSADGYLHQAHSLSAISSSTYTERHDTPRSVSELSAFSPPAHPSDSMYGSPVSYHTHLPAHPSTISMTDVQSYEDPPEAVFDIERSIYDAQPTSTGQSYNAPERDPEPETSATPGSVSTEDEFQSQDDDPDYVEAPTIRSRRPAARNASSPQQSRQRVNKRSAPRRTSMAVARGRSTSSHADDSEGEAQKRPFFCPLAPYGCMSTFGSKNEWKRHFSTQHMRLSFWRCDQCPAGDGRKPNDFNRKDLFMQHVRRMHTSSKTTSSARKSKAKQLKNAGDDREAVDAAERCHKKLRAPPTKSVCVICRETFHGPSSWDKRMEHMGKHFEDARRSSAGDRDAVQVESWDVDHAVEEWMLKQGILRPAEDGAVVLSDENRD